ncbi:unnamed protein product [Lasius platythorax]|uniref:Uncharacterized protein n=1 Tax=Lasius platythorax TaxID=488582 RepID=A0AAV2P6G5_9HYME
MPHLRFVFAARFPSTSSKRGTPQGVSGTRCAWLRDVTETRTRWEDRTCGICGYFDLAAYNICVKTQRARRFCGLRVTSETLVDTDVRQFGPN